MRTLSLLFAIGSFLVTGTASADHRHHPETRTADTLVRVLSDLSEEANYYARRDARASRDLGRIARLSAQLSMDVGRQIAMPLAYDLDLYRVRRAYRQLSWEIGQLEDIIYNCGRLPGQITRLASRVGTLWHRLGRELDQCGGHPGPGPGPGPDPRRGWQCTANDAGWEEHRGGHTATGRTRMDAEFEAIELCERYHGRCVISSCRQLY